MNEEKLILVDRDIECIIPSLDGWCTVEKAKRMARLVTEFDAPQCVELGVFGGRGVVAMGLAIKHGDSNGAVCGIDPFTPDAALEGTNEQANVEWWSKLDYQKVLRGAREGINKAGLFGIVTLVLHRSQDVVNEWGNGSIDVLHQDSNHAEEISCYEVATWAPKMKPGGYWVFDDTNWTTTRLAQERLVTQKGFTKLEDHESWAIFRAP